MAYAGASPLPRRDDVTQLGERQALNPDWKPTGIRFGDDRTYHPKLLWGGQCGDVVGVRPVDPELNNKTFLGVLLGEIALYPSVSYQADEQSLIVRMGSYNPAIFIPELNRVVFGIESWWGKIQSEDQLHQITDEDITNVWYVKALKQLQEKTE